MKINKLTITGMHKIGRKSYEFKEGVTYFVGQNGAGKSTILEAIQLGLLGYIPGYAKTNEAIMKHASGPSLSISLTLDNDIVINRTWVRSGSSVKSTLDVVNYDAKQLNNLISDVELPIFNFNEFKSMTSNKLKEWFISFLPSATEGIDLRQKLSEAVSDRSLPYDSLLNEIMSKSEASGLSGLELVKTINTWIKEDQSFIKGQISKLQGTIESLIHYDDAPIVDEDDVISQINDLTRLLDSIARYESAKNIFNKANESLSDLKDSLPADCFSNDSRIATMEAKIKEIDDKCSKFDALVSEINNEEQKLVAHHAKLLQDRSSIGSVNSGNCPYTKQQCETLVKLNSNVSKKLSELDAQIKEVSDKLNEIRSRKPDMSSYRALHNEKQQLTSNIEFIRGQYSKLDALQSQIIDPGVCPSDKSTSDISAEISKLNRDLAMIQANKKFDELTDQVTKDKFARENDLEVLKIWDKLTGANGLQTELMDRPFQNLAEEMSIYLTKMFGVDTKAQFNLSSKSNSFSFGLIRDDAYIEFDYLSSGERCLFTLALTMCILNKSESQVRVILIDDILDHLDDNNNKYLFSTLKDIDNIQFIMAGVKECPYPEMCEGV